MTSETRASTIDRSRRCLLVAVLLVLGLLSCGRHRDYQPSPRVGDQVPQYGGELDIATVYMALSALSWDTEDWNWKLNHDAGGIFEQLFVADLDQSVTQGGDYAFRADAWVPPSVMKGELAESWEWETPLTLVIHLRKGVQFAAREGVMAARELTAEDVVYSFERSARSPKVIASMVEHVDAVTARDRYTVVFEFNQYRADWAYRFGYGYYSSIVPRELENVDAKDWRNVTGSGPFSIDRYISGNSQSYLRNPDYWGRAEIGGQEYQLPFVDRINYRIIRDEATQLSALRTGKLDIVEAVRWIAVDHLKNTTPELQWTKSVAFVGTFLSLRVDEKPFDDIRVRRALNMAVDKQAIVDHFWGGNAELMAFPMHPEYQGYFQPLEEMPDSVQQLFRYDPEEARRLLAEAGYADGFSFTTQVNSVNAPHMELAPLIADYLAAVGVEMILEPLEYTAFLSLMTRGEHGPGYLLDSGHVSPHVSLFKNFYTGQLWNPSRWSDSELDAQLDRIRSTRDDEEARLLIRQLTVEMLDQAPYIWLPAPYTFTAWWPWVKNYHGELRAGAVRPGPIYARIWIDQELKRELGF